MGGCGGSRLSEFFRGRGLLHLKVGSMKGKMGGRLSRGKGADRLGREIRRNRSAIGRCWQEHGRVGREQGMHRRRCVHQVIERILLGRTGRQQLVGGGVGPQAQHGVMVERENDEGHLYFLCSLSVEYVLYYPINRPASTRRSPPLQSAHGQTHHRP